MQNIKKKEDREVAEDMGAKSPERLGETQKRKGQDIQLSQVKKKERGSAGDAVAFLRERTEAMTAARKEDISMQVQQQEFLELMQQQQQQEHQQSQLMMALLSKLQDK